MAKSTLLQYHVKRPLTQGMFEIEIPSATLDWKLAACLALLPKFQATREEIKVVAIK